MLVDVFFELYNLEEDLGEFQDLVVFYFEEMDMLMKVYENWFEDVLSMCFDNYVKLVIVVGIEKEMKIVFIV